MAVDSEYRMHLSDDSIRQYAVLQELVNVKHPMHRFTIGNTDTLPGPNHTLTQLRDTAIEFFNTYYTADNMMLVVGGPQPISELRTLANRTFGNIKRFGVLISVITSSIVQRKNSSFYAVLVNSRLEEHFQTCLSPKICNLFAQLHKIF